MGGVTCLEGSNPSLSVPVANLTPVSFGRGRGPTYIDGPPFDIRTVALEPGGTLAYDEKDWHGALVTVESGEIELQLTCGRSCFFKQGDLLWFQGLPLASLHNRGDEPTLLIAASRNREVP